MVFGRGVLHLSVLIETMRREGYELQIGQPQVIIKEIDGVKCEPVEEMTIDLPETVSGKAVELVTMRKGEMMSMEAKGDRMVCEFIIPSRGIIGLRNQLLTATAGEAIMAHRFKEYQPETFRLFEAGNDVYNTNEEQKFLDENYHYAPICWPRL